MKNIIALITLTFVFANAQTTTHTPEEFAAHKDKVIEVLFDGVYNNSSVWINGHFLGKRPYGYSSFSYNLTDYLNFDGSENIIAVQVDRKAFIDSRWYTGSGIYRNVHLMKKNQITIVFD